MQLVNQLSGKVALVTGGSAGIGRATALEFGRQGAQVIVTDVAVEEGQKTTQMIQGAGGEATFIEADISNAPQVSALIRNVVDVYGRLDFAHNNAGIATSKLSTIANYPEAEWHRIIAINLTGVWLCMKFEIQQMLKNGGGAIVNTASIAGLMGVPGSSAYTASKFGVVGLTQGVALEYADAGIRINAVCPGYIRTPMVDQIMKQETKRTESQVLSRVPMRRLGTPEEIAETVVWLCSGASYVTGQALGVDGGLAVHGFAAPPLNEAK